MFLTLLPFLSAAGSCLTATLPAGLRQFAEYQPFTPVTQTVRGLLVGGPVGSHAVAAIASEHRHRGGLLHLVNPPLTIAVGLPPRADRLQPGRWTGPRRLSCIHEDPTNRRSWIRAVEAFSG